MNIDDLIRELSKLSPEDIRVHLDEIRQARITPKAPTQAKETKRQKAVNDLLSDLPPELQEELERRKRESGKPNSLTL